MNPKENPYAPGAGTRPPELSGRDNIIDQADLALERTQKHLSARGLVLYGLRGVGKTVLLNKLIANAEAKNFVALYVEAPENHSLPAILAPALRSALFKMKRGEEMKGYLLKAFKALKGFVGALKVKYQDIEMSLDIDKDDGVADSGILETDLIDLFVAVAEAAKEKKTAVLLAIDELQYIKESQLEALIAALHRVSQNQAPLLLFAAGLPQIFGQMGKAKSYAERLFEFVSIDKLEEDAAKKAIEKPANDRGVLYSHDAIAEILKQTQGYPYFLQEWGKHSWNAAEKSPITKMDVDRANEVALSELDASFFRVRLDRLTPSEKKYLRAMAELGSAPQRSGDIAEKMGRSVTAVAPVRAKIISKGMIFSSSHGETGFTVPLFGEYLKRTIPEFD